MANLLRSLSCFALLSVLTGCVSTLMTEVGSSAISTPPPEKVKIVFMRTSFVSSAIGAEIFEVVDGQLNFVGAVDPAKLADDKQLKRIEGIINSMTRAERARPELIKASRKRRIAAGAGVPVQAVNQLLNQFEQMQKMMKMMKGGNLQRMMRGMKGMIPGIR